ncbi:type II toxin-antitoxin system Phd/YefM family antitoxin [Gemmatimonas sp.]|uniref:type II toxin-antitoxin system Phd/YefM family antitoxin n=1 Tax=Gemmatimonas sp. TaxID=1962908 RepID=UPI0035695DFF
MKRVTIHTAKTTLSQLLADAEAGEEVIIQRGQEPIVRLVALKAPVRLFGALKGEVFTTAAFFEPIPPDDLDAWER